MPEEKEYKPDERYKNVICALSILRPGEPLYCERDKCSLWDGFRGCCLLSSLLIDYLIGSYKKKKNYSKTYKSHEPKEGDAI